MKQVEEKQEDREQGEERSPPISRRKGRGVQGHAAARVVWTTTKIPQKRLQPKEHATLDEIGIKNLIEARGLGLLALNPCSVFEEPLPNKKICPRSLRPRSPHQKQRRPATRGMRRSLDEDVEAASPTKKENKNWTL